MWLEILKLHHPAKRRHDDMLTLTWRLCAAECRGCGSCGRWIRSSLCSRAWTAALSPPISAPWRCNVATLTRGAAPVVMDTDRTGVWGVVKTPRAPGRTPDVQKWQPAHRGCSKNRRPPNGPLRRWRVYSVDRFHLFVDLLWTLPIWGCLFYYCWASDKWMINLLTQWPEKHTVTKPGCPGKEPFNESDYMQRFYFPGNWKTLPGMTAGLSTWFGRLRKEHLNNAVSPAGISLFLSESGWRCTLPSSDWRCGDRAQSSSDGKSQRSSHTRTARRSPPAERETQIKAFRLIPYTNDVFEALLLQIWQQ